jgi:hypothetical protein
MRRTRRFKDAENMNSLLDLMVDNGDSSPTQAPATGRPVLTGTREKGSVGA